MSVHRKGDKWAVRYRDGARNRSRSFDRKRDAEGFDAEQRRLRQTGDLAALEPDRATLQEFAGEWMRLYVIPTLAPQTRRLYAQMWDSHVAGRVGGVPLRKFDVRAAQGLMAELEAAGVGRAARRKPFTRSCRARCRAQSSGDASRPTRCAA